MGMGRDGAPGSAGLHLAAGVPLLHPDEQVFAGMLEGWRVQQLARNLAFATVGRREATVSAFCWYVTDPAYGWTGQCQERFGTHPVQVVHEWNTAVHVQQNEADPCKRAFTLDELQALFDHADEQAVRVRGGGRKGWLPVFRDAVALKVAYGFG